MLRAKFAPSQLIAVSFAEAEDILFKIRYVVDPNYDLNDLRLSGRYAAYIFRSMGEHQSLQGSLGSVNLDFGHNTFHSGPYSENRIDPEGTLQALLDSWALAPISTVFIRADIRCLCHASLFVGKQ
jgi:hypothetical protein